MSDVDKLVGEIYQAFEGNEMAAAYSERHGIQSQAVLTITTDEQADATAEWLRPRIEGKTVVEIGGGLGLLSCHMGHIAKRVYCIEANPMWTWLFAVLVYKSKPRNVSFLFGTADEFLGVVKADVAVFCTHSGVEAMRLVAGQFGREVIDVYGELIAENPEAFDEFAREARRYA